MNQKYFETHHGCVDENKRVLLKTTFGVVITSIFAGATTQVLAQETKSKFEYIPSKLGIDYYALAPSPLAEMLSQGEVEWMENARADYAEDTVEVWKDDLAPEIATGAVSEITIENLREFTPKMLTKFSVGLHPQDKKYGYLWAIGTNYIASGLASKTYTAIA